MCCLQSSWHTAAAPQHILVVTPASQQAAGAAGAEAAVGGGGARLQQRLHDWQRQHHCVHRLRWECCRAWACSAGCAQCCASLLGCPVASSGSTSACIGSSVPLIGLPLRSLCALSCFIMTAQRGCVQCGGVLWPPVHRPTTLVASPTPLQTTCPRSCKSRSTPTCLSPLRGSSLGGQRSGTLLRNGHQPARPPRRRQQRRLWREELLALGAGLRGSWIDLLGTARV